MFIAEVTKLVPFKIKRQFCVWCVFCAVMAMCFSSVSWASELRNTPTPYEWDKDTVYALDLRHKNTIVQLPVLKFKSEYLAGVCDVQEGAFEGFFVGKDGKEPWRSRINFPKMLPPSSDVANRGKELYSCYGFAQCANVSRSVRYWPPFLGYGNMSFFLLSPVPVNQWTIKFPQRQEGDSFKVEECALTSPKEGQVLISYGSEERPEAPKQLALVNLKTGNITDIPGAMIHDEITRLTYACWLNDHQIVLLFRGRKNADWGIYEIPSGKVLGRGMDVSDSSGKSTVTDFFVSQGFLLTGDEKHIIRLFPLNETQNK